ncbi:MAG TPA: SRPBCC family protein [Candidatus Dormibacteraeota bacterium]|jgi:ligand-binding SRPBCC domain-containing protein
MPHFDESIVINRPPAEVWAYLTDFFNAPRVSGSGIIGLRQTSPGALGVGSTLQGRRVVLGFETRNEFQITEWDPPHVLATTAAGRPFRSLVSRMTLEATSDGTRMVMRTQFELQPALKLLWPFMGPIIRRRMHASYARSKALIEAKPQARESEG